jgi:hypothetical protein
MCLGPGKHMVRVRSRIERIEESVDHQVRQSLAVVLTHFRAEARCIEGGQPLKFAERVSVSLNLQQRKIGQQS